MVPDTCNSVENRHRSRIKSGGKRGREGGGREKEIRRHSRYPEFMNGETLVTRGYPIPRSLDLCGLRSRIIKLFNLPWKPSAIELRYRDWWKSEGGNKIAVLIRFRMSAMFQIRSEIHSRKCVCVCVTDTTKYKISTITATECIT